MAITPPADTDIRLTAESVRMVVNAERIFRNSHTLTVLSSDPDTTLSSRVKTVDVTLLHKIIMKHYFLLFLDKLLILLTRYDPGRLKQPVFDRENPIVETLNLLMPLRLDAGMDVLTHVLVHGHGPIKFVMILLSQHPIK